MWIYLAFYNEIILFRMCHFLQKDDDRMILIKKIHTEQKIVNNQTTFSITLCLLPSLCTHIWWCIGLWIYSFLVPLQMLVLFLPFSSSSSPLSAISLSLSILWMVFCVLRAINISVRSWCVFVYVNIIIYLTWAWPLSLPAQTKYEYIKKTVKDEARNVLWWKIVW